MTEKSSIHIELLSRRQEQIDIDEARKEAEQVFGDIMPQTDKNDPETLLIAQENIAAFFRCLKELSPDPVLNARRREVFLLQAEGCNNAKIATQLDMTPDEVRDDRDRIRQAIKIFQARSKEQ